jgi:hypothetical protein
MTNKPWVSEPGGNRLQAYVGAAGFKTSELATSSQLVDVAAILFEVPAQASVGEMSDMVAALGQRVRGERGRRNIEKAAAARQNGTIEQMMANSQPHIIDGEPFGVDGQIDVDPAKLLRQVVSAVISAGHAADLYEFPDVLAFFGARIPECADASRAKGVGH